MNCKDKTPITIYKGFGTKWDNNDLIFVTFDSEIYIKGFSVEFTIGKIVKRYDNIEDGFAINLTAAETDTLELGPIFGSFIVIDNENNKRPFSTELPFVVKDWEDGDVELDGFKIQINAKVQDNKLTINISTDNPITIVENTMDSKIQIHNESEQAHSYIQGLISDEATNRENADSGLNDLIEANKQSIQDLELNKQDKVIAGAGISVSGATISNAGVRNVYTGSTNGTITVNTNGENSPVAVYGLKSAAFTLSTDYATASQGQKADSALQPNDNISELTNDAGYITDESVGDGVLTISTNGTPEGTFSANASSNKTIDISVPTTVAELSDSNDYALKTDIGDGLLILQRNGTELNSFSANAKTNTLVNIQVPTTPSDIGAEPEITASNKLNADFVDDSTTTNRFVTVEEISDWNSKQDELTQTQLNAVNSGIDSNKTEQIATNATDISNIEALIPNQASTGNQLADKNFVNSSIATNTANFIGTFNSVQDLENYSGTVTNNDYAFVIGTDSSGNTVYNRYKYTTAVTPAEWEFEYALNNSSFTANQWDAINSGATTTNINQITTNKNDIANLQSNKVDANSAITGATKCKITYDGKGLVTYGADLSASDIPNITLSKISDVSATASELNILDGATISTSELNILNGVTINATELNTLGGVTGSIQTQLDGKQPMLTAGTNITIVGNVISSYGGVYYAGTGLTLTGTTFNHSNSITSGTAGTSSATSGDTLDVPYITYDAQGHISDAGTHEHTISGFLSDATKYGADLSYSSNSLQLLDQDGNTLGSAVTIQSSPDVDGISITTNDSDELQTIGVIDQNNTTNALKTWSGTKAQYDSLVSGGTIDANTIYNITDDTNLTQALLEAIYPVGSIYIGTMNICPLSALFGTWELVAADRVLQGSGTYSAGDTVEAGLPNITGSFRFSDDNDTNAGIRVANTDGCFYGVSSSQAVCSANGSSTQNVSSYVYQDASRSSSIYGNSTTVQPPAFVVNIWKRTA